MLRHLLELVVVLASLGAGWWGGSWSGRQAKQALETVQQTAAAAEQAHARAQQTLNAELAELTSRHDAQLQQLKQQATQREQDMAAVLARRDQRLAELERALGGRQAELAQLRARRADAATPHEQQKLDQAIARTEQQVQAIAVEADGRRCMAVPVPDDLLAAWRGGRP